MKSVEDVIRKNKKIRVMGFDDAPFSHERGATVNVSGIVCSNTRFEGMIWTEVEKDGANATEQIVKSLKESKFFPQLHVLLFDGIAFGGFNILDLSFIALESKLPCIAVMRKQPDLQAIDEALKNFDDYERRKKLVEKAGDIFEQSGFVFQCHGLDSDIAAKVLNQTTDTGKVPEPLRLAHLIGSAIKTGESGKRA